MSRLLQGAKREMYSILPALIFFGLSFNLLHFSCILLLGSGHVRFTSYVGATIGAILAAKVIIIVRNLPFINAFPNKPLVYNICWKLVIYSFFVLLVQVLDFMFRKITHHGTTVLAFQQLKLELINPMFWGTQVLIIFTFLVYLTLSELARAIGQQEFKKLLFGY